MSEGSFVRRTLVTVEGEVDVGIIGDVKDMSVDNLVRVMKELFTHLKDVMRKNEKERTKARRFLRALKLMRKLKSS